MDSFAAYESSEETLTQIGNLDREVQELKSRTEKYLQTGAASQLSRANELEDSLRMNMAAIIGECEDEKLNETLTEMQEKLDVFRDRLGSASQERDLRTQLIQVDLPNQDNKVHRQIDKLQKILATNASSSMPQELLQLVQSHAASFQRLESYFTSAVADDYDQALTSIKRSRELAAAIGRKAIENDPESAPALGDSIDQLNAELIEFKRLGSRAFQATRGYMFYSNVVMAGEISEFSYRSNQLKQYVEDQRAVNREARQKSATQSRLLGLLASCAAVAVAGLMAARLSYLIVKPISGITETFRKLGQGETVAEIPSLERNDEIGRMARAAKIFNDKNQETSDLLEQAKRLTGELAAKATALEKTNQELDNFAYVASHDLRSPLRGIKHLTTWVQEDCEELLPESSQKHLQQMNERAIKMEQLLDDLLEYSRAGRLATEPEDIDVGELIASVVALNDTPEGFRILLTNPTFLINTVRTPLTQVLMNLITNGVKYNDKGREGKVEISAFKQDDFVHFTVKDNGRGIAPEHRDQVFEMYRRVAVDVQDGSGMGLAIVKKLVLSFGGTLTLQSELGNGTEISFTWPCGMDKCHTTGTQASDTGPPEIGFPESSHQLAPQGHLR